MPAPAQTKLRRLIGSDLFLSLGGGFILGLGLLAVGHNAQSGPHQRAPLAVAQTELAKS